jgi:ATP-dependent RNA helicase DDX19/DBP5
MSPTNELAQGIYGVVTTYAKQMGISTQLLVAREKGQPDDAVNKSAHILIGTTGRVTNVFNLKDRSKPWYIDPSTISLLILDEADKMLNSLELGDQTKIIRGRCKNVKQTLLSSATYSQELLEVSKGFLRPSPWSLVRIVPREGVSEFVVPKEIKHFVLRIGCPGANEAGVMAKKLKAVEDICRELEGLVTFVFSNFKKSCDTIDTRLRAHNLKSYSLTGNLKPHERTQFFKEFNALRYRFCVSTNISARGIDIPKCTTVINFDIPVIFQSGDRSKPDPVTYVHRAGRTGRYGRSGVCISFVTSHEEFAMMESIFKSCIQTDNNPIVFEVHTYDPENILDFIDAIRRNIEKTKK